MPGTVLAPVARSEIGRAHAGILCETRVDDLATRVARATLAELLQLPLEESTDLIPGSAFPSGEGTIDAPAPIDSTTVAGLLPEAMGLGPFSSIRADLTQLGQGLGDMDRSEIRGDSAVEAWTSAKHVRIPLVKINVVSCRGNAVGNPVGATGAWPALPLSSFLQRHGQDSGVESTCLYGSMAMAPERLS